MTRPRGYFGVPRDHIALDGKSPPGRHPAGRRRRVDGARQARRRGRRAIVGEFNDERIVGRTCPRLHGVQVSPASSVRKTPAAVMATYMHRWSRGSSWTEWQHRPARTAGNQPSRVGMLEQRAVDLPRLATVVGTEEHAGGGAEVERLGLFDPARRDVQHGLHGQARLLRQADLLRAPPRPTAVLQRWTVEP